MLLLIKPQKRSRRERKGPKREVCVCLERALVPRPGGQVHFLNDPEILVSDNAKLVDITAVFAQRNIFPNRDLTEDLLQPVIQ